MNEGKIIRRKIEQNSILAPILPAQSLKWGTAVGLILLPIGVAAASVPEHDQ